MDVTLGAFKGRGFEPRRSPFVCASVCAKMPPSVVLQVVKMPPSVVLQNLWPFLLHKIGKNAAKCRVRVSGVHCVPRRMLDSDSCVVRQIALIVPLGSPSAQVFIYISVSRRFKFVMYRTPNKMGQCHGAALFFFSKPRHSDFDPSY